MALLLSCVRAVPQSGSTGLAEPHPTDSSPPGHRHVVTVDLSDTK